MKKKYVVVLISIVLFLGVFFVSCIGKNKKDKGEKYKTVYQGDWSDLDLLPPDTGGEHRAVLGSEYPGAKNGFYIYLPKGYESSPIKYPTIIFFHGSNESGNGMERSDVLSDLLRNGIPLMIDRGTWNPPVPFIVISPQTVAGEFWKGFDQTLDSLIKEYPIDTSRIYATGLSMGGFAVWGILAYSGERTFIAAGVPVCGLVYEFQKNQNFYSENLTSFPIWAFHGEKDIMVPTEQDRTIIETVNKLDPVFPIKYTQFPELAHNMWNQVYQSKLETKTDPNYDPYDMDIYSWMLQYRRIKK